jgi:hypothetical protein
VKPCHPGAQHYQLAQDSSGHRTRPATIALINTGGYEELLVP